MKTANRSYGRKRVTKGEGVAYYRGGTNLPRSRRALAAYPDNHITLGPDEYKTTGRRCLSTRRSEIRDDGSGAAVHSNLC